MRRAEEAVEDEPDPEEEAIKSGEGAAALPIAWVALGVALVALLVAVMAYYGIR
jgi:hypothetical protein